MNHTLKCSIYLFFGSAAIALLSISGGSAVSRQGNEITQPFHQVFSISSRAQIKVDNINGNVNIRGWDSNQIQVDATKRADSEEKLDAEQIQVDAKENAFAISTKYTSKSNPREFLQGPGASVDYTLLVPQSAQLSVNLVNGDLTLDSFNGDAHASSVNGHVSVTAAHLSSHSSSPEARGQDLELSSVNGSVTLLLPSNADAKLDARTLRGEIHNDFGLAPEHRPESDHTLKAQFGGGANRVSLQNVNGSIWIRRQTDGRPLSKIQTLSRSDDHAVIFLNW